MLNFFKKKKSEPVQDCPPKNWTEINERPKPQWMEIPKTPYPEIPAHRIPTYETFTEVQLREKEREIHTLKTHITTLEARITVLTRLDEIKSKPDLVIRDLKTGRFVSTKKTK